MEGRAEARKRGELTYINHGEKKENNFRLWDNQNK